jgi:hypothetical protein
MLAPPTPPNDEQTQKPLGYNRGTGLRMSILALVFAGVLVVGFFFVNSQRRHKINELAAATRAKMSGPPDEGLPREMLK